MSSKVDKALKAREARLRGVKTSGYSDVENDKVRQALEEREKRNKSNINSILADIQRRYDEEVEAYKSSVDNYQSRSYGQEAYKNTVSSQNDRRVAISDLKSELKGYSKYIGDYNTVNKTIAQLDQMIGGYDSIASNAEYWSQWETEDDYNKWVADNEEYEKKKTYDLERGERELSWLEGILSEAKNRDAQAKKELANAGRGGDSVAANAAYSNYKAQVLDYLSEKGYSSIDELEKTISNKKVYYNQSKRIQEGVRLSGVADPESELYDTEFNTHSRYVSTKSDEWYSKLTSQYGLGYSDLAYEYINNVDGIRDEINDKARAYGKDTSQYKEKGYDFLKEQEVAIYNYYYAKDGKEAAEKYLDSIQETLNQRKANERFKNFEDNTFSEILFSIPAGVDQFESGIKNLLNTNDDYIPVSDTQFLSQKVREDLSDDGWKLPEFLGGSSLGQVAYDIGSTTSNMLPSIIVGAATNPIVGTSLLGASAAGNAYQEMLNYGYDKGQARLYSTLVGVSEAGLEYVLGGISKLGGKATGGLVTKLLSKIDNAYARAAIRFGGSMLSEGFEEGLQEYLDPWFKSIALNTDYEAANLDEILYSGLLGALSAFGLEGTNIVSSEVATYSQGKNLKTYGEVERLVELGKTFSADTVANQIANRIDKNTGAYTIGRLFNEVGATLSEKNISDITNALVERSIDTKYAKILVEGLENTVNGVELTKKQQDALEKNPVLADVWNDVIINPNSTVMQRSMAYSRFSDLSKSKAEASASDTSEIYNDPETVQAIVEEGVSAPEGTQSKALATEYSEILKNGGTLSAEQVQKLVSANEEVYPAEKTTTKYKVGVDGKVAISLDETTSESTSNKDENFDTITGEKISNFKEFSDISLDGKVAKLRLEDGNEVNAKNVSLANSSDAYIVEGLLNMTVDNAHLDTNTANVLLKEMRNSINAPLSNKAAFNNLATMIAGTREALTYGYYGYDSKQLIRDSGMASEISDSLRNTAYVLGRDLGKGRMASNQAKITNAIEARKQSGVEKAEAEGKLRFDGGEKKALEGLSSDQKAVVVFFRDIAVATPSGIKLIGYDKRANGYTNLTTGEMVFSLESNASRDPVAAVLFTAGHESGHYIKLHNPEGFNRLGEFLAKEYGKKGVSVHAHVLAMQKKSKSKLTYDEAHEEWVCQSLQRMFASVINNKDSGVLQRLQQYDNKVAQLLYKALSKLASKISSLLEKLTPGTFEEQFVAEMDATARKLFEAMYAEELVTAIDNAQWLSGVDVMTEILGNKNIEVGQTSLQEMNRRQTRFQEKTEYEAQPKEIITVGTDAKKPKANRKTLGGRNKVTIAGKTFKGDVSVKELRDARFKENGFSQEEIDKHNEFIQHMAEMMEEARVKYRFIGLDDIYNAKILISPTSGEITLSALVNNGDYPINFDFTKVCKKRVALQQIVDQLARQKGKENADGTVTEVNLSPENIKAINDILAREGIETACLCCFVESKRYNIQALLQENVIDVWNSLVDEFDSNAGYFNFADESVNESKIPDKEFDALYQQVVAWRKQKGKDKLPDKKMRQFLETTPAARKKLRFADLVTEKGRTNLHKLYPDIESLIGSKLGTSAPKSIEAFAPYNGEIDLMEATGETELSDYLFSIAGARSQSFSDFMIAHIFDVVQKTASLSARKLPAHVYTKEIARARLFGMTGEKHNMSVLFNIDPEVDSWNAGLKKDGSYFLSDYKAYSKKESQYIQSIGWDDAVNLQNTEGYSKDCGIIAVGFSYNNMIKIHNDPEVRQVIGYHTSSLSAVVKPLTHLDKATDYTPVQNTLAFKGFVKPMYAIPEGVPSYATPPQDIKPIKGKAKTRKVSDTFDIKATFEKLAKGKKGEARTQAAKETLRQLLEYAESNGLALKTSKAEAGHGDFDLYSDVEKTKNPYQSADHYIEYCIERGYLPAFFEFAMNQNYYKDIFDWTPFDRLSYNPETGLHEDSDGRQAYAPQTAVHMLNEDGSYAFPSDFFEIVDKQMKNYDEYSHMVEEKMSSVMKAITSIEGMGSNLKFQFRMETDPKKISEAENLEKKGASRQDIWDGYGVIRDAGGNWVTEFSDKYARIYPRADAIGETPTGTIRLKNIFKHTELYTRFPEAAEIVIDLESGPFVAKYNRKTNTISINKSHLNNLYELKVALLHEIQHFIQNQEGRPRGASVKYYENLGFPRKEAEKAYFYTAGEIEARMSADRIDLDDSQRISKMPDYQWGKAKIRYQERESLTPDQQKHFDYNAKQKSVGSSLKTLKGSTIKRSTKYGVGKEIGGEIYFHKDYAEDILPPEVLSQAEHLLEENQPGFEYNCLKYNPKTGVVAFQEAPDFDSAREPIVGDYVSVNTNTGVVKTGHSNYIWHHKWNWVKNDYSGFDVRESWEWSKEWLSTLTEVSDGNGIERWNTQLDKFGLPHDGESKTPTLRYQLREVDPVKPSNSDWRPAHNESWFAENGFPLYRNVSEEQRTANEQHEMDKRSGGHGTQNKSTLPTYEKIFKFIKDRGDNPRILDASAGLGLGTELGKEYGLDIHDIEPFPNENYKPEWTDYEGLQKLVENGEEKPFDIIISNAVLNVLAQDSRDNLVAAMDSLLRPGGQMFINVIGKDYSGAKNASPEIQRNSKGIPVGTVLTQEGENGAGREVFVWQSNSVQKVFSSTELKSYLQDALGDGYVVDTPAKAWKGSGLSGTMVVVTKPSNSVKRYQEREVSTITEAEYKELEKHFGTTGNFRVAGYLLTDGKLLDFSGKHWGDTTSRMRQVDHRDVSEVLNRGNNGIDDMVDMIGNGNIRLMPEVGGINLAVYPNEKQRRVLSLYINQMLNTEGEVVIDYDSVGGDTVYSKVYGKTATSKQILSDIRNYFNGARQSELMQFHTMYQERSTEDISNRGLLANALESAAAPGEEKNLLRNYKTNIRLIEAEQKRLSEIKDKLFAKGSKLEPEERKKLQSEMKQTSARINSYDRQLLKLEAMQPIKKVLAREKDMAKKRQKQKDMQILADYKEKSKATVKELLERNQESRKKAIEGRNKTLMRHKIKGVVNELNQLLLKGSKERNVKIGLQSAVAEALKAINMDTVDAEERIATLNAKIAKAKDPDVIESLTATRDRIQNQGDVLKDKLEALEEAYTEIEQNGNEVPAYYKQEIAAIKARIISVKKAVGNTPIRNMSLAQLESVYELYSMVLTTVRNANKLFVQGKLEDLQRNASATMEEIAAIKKRSEERWNTSWADSFSWNEMIPVYAFRRMGSQTFEKFFWEAIRGQNTVARDLEEANSFASEAREKYGYSKWDFNKVHEFKMNDGRTFRITLKHMMSIYAYSKRNQALDHMSKGGFFFNDKETFRKKGGIFELVKKNEVGYCVDSEMLEAIKTKMDEVDHSVKLYVDEMQEYLTKMGEKGNEVSRAVWGIDIFKEKIYFPLKSVKDFIFQANQTAQESSLKNDGMTKETKPGASNPIVLEAFDEVWVKHVNRMSQYHGLVIPIDNLNKIHNYGTWAETDSMSVSTMLGARFGEAVNDYINQFIKDLNGASSTSGATNPFLGFVSKFKKTAVAASTSVVVQQPTAVIRANAVLDAKYFIGIPKVEKLVTKWDEIKKYAPIAIIKEIGGFEMGSGRQVADWLNSDTKQGLDKVMNTIDDWTMKGAEIGDMVGWCTIWEAVKREVKATTNLTEGSKEFLDKVGERFTEVIVLTQVYDSTLSRSGYMRSKHDSVKMLTSFMGEPTVSMNMMFDATVQAKRGKITKRKAGRIISATYAAMITASVLASMVYGFRDDDDDESYIEKFAEALGVKLLGDLNPLNMLPGFRDIISILDGWDVERTDMAVFKDIKDAFDGLDSDSKSAWRKTEDLAGAFAALFGLPLKNVLRTSREIYNVVENLFDDFLPKDVGEAFARGITGEKKNKNKEIYDAIVSGDKARLEVYRKDYKTEESFETAIRKALRENDPRIKEAAKELIAGNIQGFSKYIEAIATEGHFDKEMVEGAIRSEKSYFDKKIREAYEAKAGGDEEEYKKIVRELRDSYKGIYSQDDIVNFIKNYVPDEDETSDDKEEATSIYKASDINSALENGDTSAALEVINDLVKVKTENYIAEGKSKKEAEKSAKSSIRSSLTSYWKPLYLAAYNAKNNAEMARIRKLLNSTKVYDNVVETCQDWVKQSKKSQ